MVDLNTGAFVPVSSQEKLRQKEDKRIENMRRSVIILRNGKNNVQSDEPTTWKQTLIKSRIGEKIDQNFSAHGARLTSIATLGSLEMRDRILSTFTVHDSKHKE